MHESVWMIEIKNSWTNPSIFVGTNENNYNYRDNLIYKFISDFGINGSNFINGVINLSAFF